MKRLVILALVCVCSVGIAAADPIVGARSLALSPDGTRVAFTYLGDIWVASANGGTAVAVTNNVEMDDNPVWSPDGTKIAFASNRYGNQDIFVVAADGGKPKRITYHTGAEVPSSWTPDGKSILFKATRDDSNNGIYSVDVATGKFKQLFLDMMPVGSPQASPDGTKVLYTRFGFSWQRARYEGSAAAQLWIFDTKTGKREELRNTRFQHLWPAWTTAGAFAVTMTQKVASSSTLQKSVGRVEFPVEGTPNVYSFSANGKAKRITDFAKDGVRFLSVNPIGTKAVFERDADVYSLDLTAKKPTPVKLSFTANVDDKVVGEESQVVTSGVSDVRLSPDGSTVLFQAKNDLWSVPVKKGEGPNKDDATRLTDWEGFDESPLYSPDGLSAFFVSDRDGAEKLYKMTLATKEVVAITKEDADIKNLQITPDRKSLSFYMTGKNGGLFTYPVGGGELKQVYKRPGADGFEYNWSPDGKYVAFSDTLLESGYYYWDSGSNIHILDVTTGTVTNVTQLNAQHQSPAWSPDGKYLFFTSNRSGDGIYVLPLKPEEARGNETTLKFEKPKDPVKVEIDFVGIETRIRKLNNQSASGLEIDREDGSIYFRTGGDISKSNFNGEEVRKVTQSGNVGAWSLSDDQKQLVTTQGGAVVLVNLKANGFPATPVSFRAEWTRDLTKERHAAFVQFWREFNRGFYDPNFHGRDWVALKAKYEKYLPSVGHRNEMALVLGMMVGELESSHSEVSPGPGNPSSAASAHLGFTFDYSYDGPGIKIKEVPNRTPGSFAKSKLVPGEIVTKINGKDASVSESLYSSILNDQTGRELKLTVTGLDGKEREVKYRALSGGEFGAIVFGNRIEARRKYVEAKSGGKLTYVHIAGMSGPEFERFNQQMWMYAKGKQGVIIDVRNNGGGNTSDRIIDILERRQNSFYVPRDEAVIKGPGQTFDMPLVVMCAETSYSNAEMFPAAMKARKLANLVGKQTPGYVIYTGGFNLVDGTVARMPGTGAYRMDGSNLEDNGEVPDFDVDITPEQYFLGIDPQIDKAIEVLTKK